MPPLARPHSPHLVPGLAVIIKALWGACLLYPALYGPMAHCAEGNPLAGLPSLKISAPVSARQDQTYNLVKPSPAPSVPRSSGAMGLKDILLLVRTRHPAIASKSAELDAADAGKLGAQLRFLPAPSLDTTSRDGKTATTVRLEQPLWTGGKLMAGLDSAEAKARMSNANLTETELALSLRATSLYQNYLAIKNRISVLDNGIRRMQDLGDMITRRAQSGTSASADVDLAHSRIGQLKTERISAENNLRTTLSQLSQLTGETITVDTITSEIPAPTRIDMEEIELRVMSAHPTLLRAQLDIDLATADKAMAKAVLWPTVSVRAEHQEGEYLGSQLAGNRVYFALTYTPGAGLASLTDISAASARIRSAEGELENKRRDLLDKLRTEQNDFETTRLRQAELTRNSKLTADILDSSTRLFVLGRRSWLDLLNAVREMVSAQQQEVDNKALAYGAYQRLRLWAGEPVWHQE